MPGATVNGTGSTRATAGFRSQVNPASATPCAATPCQVNLLQDRREGQLLEVPWRQRVLIDPVGSGVREGRDHGVQLPHLSLADRAATQVCLHVRPLPLIELAEQERADLFPVGVMFFGGSHPVHSLLSSTKRSAFRP